MADDRREIEKLLPFYANETLESEERARVEAALADDAELRAELEFLGALRSQVKAVDRPGAPGELGLKRLLRDVRRERRSERYQRIWRPALALAAAIAIVAQFIVIAQLRPDDGARLLGGERATLQVTFVETAIEADIRGALRSAGATIVDGPSAMGVYRVRIEPPPESDAALDAVIDALERRSDVVSLVARE